VGGTVYIGSGDSTVYALDADTGRERWSFETGDRIWESSPAVVDGTLYIGSGDNSVYALDADDGTERWSFETDDTIKSSPAVANGTVYVGSWDDHLYALDADDGTERWSFDTGFGPSSSPAVVDGTVYVGDDSGKVVGVSADDGTEQWSFGTGEESVVSSPAVANGTVYIGANDSNVYALTGETATPTPEPTPEPTATPVPADDEFGDGEGGGGGGGGGGDTGGSGQTEAILTLGGGIAALGGLWYWRRQGSTESDADDRPGGGTRAADTSGGGTRTATTPDDGPGSGGVDTGSPGGGSAGAAVVDDSPPPGVDTHADALETGDERRQEAAALADRGDHREALARLDDAETAYLDALDAARSTDRLDAGKAEGRLTAVDDDRREIRRDRLTARRDALRADLDHAADRVDDDPERASERLSTLESRISALGDRAGEMGFDDLQETVAALESERASLLADAEASLTGGPPTRIPRAPAVSVDYDALTDEEPIGAGGNADVVRATLPTADGNVTLAIKRPRMSGTLHTDAIDRMLDEAETWDKLDDHDHVVGVVDYGAQPVPWIAMEYMDGGDLSERAGDLEFDQALWTAVAITKGVRHAHRRGVAHLDLKPANVLFRGVEGAWDVPKVADWGLSKHLLDHSQSVEGLSPQYAAPEQFDTDRGAADDITDVYQLGAVLYELFTGRPPFEGAAPAEAMHRVLNEEPAPPSEVAALPPELDDVLLTALEKEKGDRFESVLLLRNELQRLRGD
jgi:tRNA A-37 threonylcarbamoyl transferase component Bud32